MEGSVKESPVGEPPEVASNKSKYVSMAILVFVNLLNYMDRYTIAGVLKDVQKFYNIDDAMAGLLQTVFIITFMIVSPIFGYLGDRYNRKYICIGGIAVWVISVVASTFVPSNKFYLFMIARGMVGVGEATYAVVTPSLLSDMFSGAMRSRMLMIFYFAIPIGSGLGYVVGAKMAALTGEWQWGIRCSAGFGLLSEIAIVLFLVEPERGAAESHKAVTKSSYMDDIKSLLKNKTYILSTIAYTEIVFAIGTLSWWAPTAIQLRVEAESFNASATGTIAKEDEGNVGLIFGVIMCLGGLFGVALGTGLSSVIFRVFKTSRSDAIVCALGAGIGLPATVAFLQLLKSNMNAAWVVLFVCVTVLSFNWSTNVDMHMGIVAPHRRNTSNSWLILISHLFGDAFGPFVIGWMSDTLRHGSSAPQDRFTSLVSCFYLAAATVAVSAVFYVASAYTVVEDQERMKREIGDADVHGASIERKPEGGGGDQSPNNSGGGGAVNSKKEKSAMSANTKPTVEKSIDQGATPANRTNVTATEDRGAT